MTDMQTTQISFQPIASISNASSVKTSTIIEVPENASHFPNLDDFTEKNICFQETETKAQSESIEAVKVKLNKTVSKKRKLKLGPNKNKNNNDNDKTSQFKSEKSPKGNVCSYCNKTFTHASQLSVHVRSHTGERPFQCNYCEKKFPSSSAKRKHIRIHTGERPYKCNFEDCNATFSTKETLNRHTKTHTGEKPHTCKYCGKSFIQPSQLRAHIFHHTGENGFMCQAPGCNKVFNRKTRLQMHVSYIHEGRKPFKCDICGNTFVRNEDMKRHKTLHTGQKEYSCEVCDKSFATKSSLMNHSLTHRDEPPKKCGECGRAFIREDCLMRHIKSKHRELLDVIISESESEKKKLQNMLLSNTQTIISRDNQNGIEKLKASIGDLLTVLIDKNTLVSLGWPDLDISQLLELVIIKCGHSPIKEISPSDNELSDKDTKDVDIIKENAKLLFKVVIGSESVMSLLENQTVEEVIDHVLKLAKS